MTNTPLEDLGQYDAVVIVTDHSTYDYHSIVEESTHGTRRKASIHQRSFAADKHTYIASRKKRQIAVRFWSSR